DDELEEVIRDMQATGLDLTVEGNLEDFLGVHIDTKEDGSYELSQSRLIESIITEVFGDSPPSTVKEVPMASSRLLSRHLDSEDHDESRFSMRRIVGKLNFLSSSTRPDIAYATHQIARFVSKPKIEHTKAVEWLTRYLMGTRNRGYIIKPDRSKSVEIYVDADFAGNWDPDLAGVDPDTARSRHGFVVFLAGVPLLWKSSLQQEHALSSTESELIGLSMALKTTIPMMDMLQEMTDLGFDVGNGTKTLHCELFEDNNGALAIASMPRVRPQTKHINNKYFHFLDHTSRDDAKYTFTKIDTQDQPADMLTKPLAAEAHVKHRLFVQGW
ncbi:MAG: Ty1/Copia family ribonuclease HI, partial [Cetobacterium sp.]